MPIYFLIGISAVLLLAGFILILKGLRQGPPTSSEIVPINDISEIRQLSDDGLTHATSDDDLASIDQSKMTDESETVQKCADEFSIIQAAPLAQLSHFEQRLMSLQKSADDKVAFLNAEIIRLQGIVDQPQFSQENGFDMDKFRELRKEKDSLAAQLKVRDEALHKANADLKQMAQDFKSHSQSEQKTNAELTALLHETESKHQQLFKELSLQRQQSQDYEARLNAMTLREQDLLTELQQLHSRLESNQINSLKADSSSEALLEKRCLKQQALLDQKDLFLADLTKESSDLKQQIDQLLLEKNLYISTDMEQQQAIKALNDQVRILTTSRSQSFEDDFEVQILRDRIDRMFHEHDVKTKQWQDDLAKKEESLTFERTQHQNKINEWKILCEQYNDSKIQITRLTEKLTNLKQTQSQSEQKLLGREQNIRDLNQDLERMAAQMKEWQAKEQEWHLVKTWNEQLKTQVSGLKKDLNVTQSSLENQHHHLNHLIDQLKTDNSQLLTQLKEYEQKVRDHEVDMRKAQKYQEGQLEQANDEIITLKRKVDHLQKEEHYQQHEATQHVQQELDQLAIKYRQLSDQYRKLDEDFQKLTDINDQLLQRERFLQYELTKKRAQALGLEKICEDFKMQLETKDETVR